MIDLIVRVGLPAVLVTGSYLGALSHTLTALFALTRQWRSRAGNRRLGIRGERGTH